MGCRRHLLGCRKIPPKIETIHHYCAQQNPIAFGPNRGWTSMWAHIRKDISPAPHQNSSTSYQIGEMIKYLI